MRLAALALIISLVFAASALAEQRKTIPSSSYVKPGTITNDLMPPNSLIGDSLMMTLRGQGYLGIHDLNFEDGFYWANGTNKKGERVALKINVISGRVIDAEPAVEVEKLENNSSVTEATYDDF